MTYEQGCAAVTLSCYPDLHAHGIRCIGAQGGRVAIPQTGRHVRKHHKATLPWQASRRRRVAMKSQGGVP